MKVYLLQQRFNNSILLTNLRKEILPLTEFRRQHRITNTLFIRGRKGRRTSTHEPRRTTRACKKNEVRKKAKRKIRPREMETLEKGTTEAERRLNMTTENRILFKKGGRAQTRHNVKKPNGQPLQAPEW